ncbi:MAG: glycosyltransferase family 4 protein [Sphingobacteriaceae bacterium]|nr:glycosyltransferase family 4 protein [Sphingobacteriaceae bacterium]
MSDLWPESAEKLGVITNKWLLKPAYRLEEKVYRKSILVTGQTQGICSDIEKRFPNVNTYWLPNGVDLDYYNPDKYNEPDWRIKNGFNQEDCIFLYAGILGLAQNLEIILSAAMLNQQNKKIKFVLMGSGPEENKLKQIKKEKNIENVFFLNAVSKKEMPVILKSINAAIIPLRKLDLFKGAIPSKIFENLAMRVPIILGVDGEARNLFITQGNCGLYFEPDNIQELAKCVLKMYEEEEMRKEWGKNGRTFAEKNFNRDIIAKNFYDKLKALP